MPISDELLKILICPIEMTGLTYDRQSDSLLSKSALFAIKNRIPIMLLEKESEN